jgi:hypothetical protein
MVHASNIVAGLLNEAGAAELSHTSDAASTWMTMAYGKKIEPVHSR